MGFCYLFTKEQNSHVKHLSLIIQATAILINPFNCVDNIVVLRIWRIFIWIFMSDAPLISCTATSH